MGDDSAEVRVSGHNPKKTGGPAGSDKGDPRLRPAQQVALHRSGPWARKMHDSFGFARAEVGFETKLR